MYILKQILLFLALVVTDVIVTVTIVNVVKSSFLGLPLYVYSCMGSFIATVSILVYLPLFYKIKEKKLYG